MRSFALLLGLLPTLAVAMEPVFYPGCPQWTHQLTFINQRNDAVKVVETDSCYANNLLSPFIGKCWPQQVSGGQFTLDANASKTVSVTSCWSGSFSFSLTCKGCDSTIPFQTLAEFTFDGGIAVGADGASPTKLPGTADNYDVSMVNGFSAAIQIRSSDSSCKPAGCSIQPACPDKLRVAGGCLSPNTFVRNVMSSPTEDDKRKYGCICSSTKQASCSVSSASDPVPAACVGSYGCSPFSPPGSSNPGSACCPWFDANFANNPNRQKCNAASASRAWDSWAIGYIDAVHAACPNQYAWQYDDNQGGFACTPGSGNALNYTVTLQAQSNARSR